MTEAVLHVDFVSLAPGTEPAAREALIDAAAGLAEIDGVTAVGVIEADEDSAFDLGFCFLLRDFAALEPFGTDARYVRFLQGALAPLLKGLAGADVRLDRALTGGEEQAFASCIAVAAPEETYDWEVRERLDAWAGDAGTGTATIGLAIGDRQRFRGIGLALLPTAEAGDTPPTPDQGASDGADGSLLIRGAWRALSIRP